MLDGIPQGFPLRKLTLILWILLILVQQVVPRFGPDSVPLLASEGTDLIAAGSTIEPALAQRLPPNEWTRDLTLHRS